MEVVHNWLILLDGIEVGAKGVKQKATTVVTTLVAIYVCVAN